MSESKAREPLHIKKYPNRRFYDATRSRHVTLQELHEAILAGHSLVVSDSRTGEDITNVVLVQIILEKDPPKLHLFPSWILHAMVRSKPSVLRGTIDQLLGPFTHPIAATQRQMDEIMNRALAGEIVTPMEWTQAFLRGFSAPPPSPAVNGQEPPESGEPTGGASEQVLRELRQQIAALNRRIEGLQRGAAE